MDKEAGTATLRWRDAGMGAMQMRVRCEGDDTPTWLREGLLGALFGTGCGSGTFPAREVAALGMPRRVELYVGKEEKPIVTTEIDDVRLVPVDVADLQPPQGFKPIETAPTGGDVPAPVVTPDAPPTGRVTQALETGARAGRNQQALDAEDVLTPGCLSTTRLGPMVGVLHQDLLDNIRAAINLVAPHLGVVTLAGGTLTVPWLSTLAATDVVSGGTGPGSGLFTILRQNRTLSPTLGGGNGLLDRLAWKLLSTRDERTGRTPLQQEAVDGILAATLTRWNVSPPVSAILLSNGGDMFDSRLTDADRSVLVEAYEVIDIGTIRINGLPSSPPPILWPAPAPGGPNMSLVTLSITGISGSMTFGPVGSPPLVPTFAIGSFGTIDLTVALPATTMMATVNRATTPLGTGVLIGAALTCFFFPLACATVTPLALLLLAILNDLTTITAFIPMTTLSLRVEFGYNQSTRYVEPVVTLVGATGTATVTTTTTASSSIAAGFNNVVTSLGNALNAWPTLLGLGIGAAIQGELLKQGVRFPLGLTDGLTATDGSALSTPNGTLVLSAEIEPYSNTVAQPWITQVPPAVLVRNRMDTTHFFARRELNPSVVTGTMPATLSVGVYGGLALTQNVLNSYVYARWREGAFNLVITDSALVAKLVNILPPATFGLARPQRISVWPATPPRLELAPEGLYASEALTQISNAGRQAELEPFSTTTRPLVAYFDDVRACFDATVSGSDVLNQGQSEFSFNFRTTATLDLSWPFSLALRTDAGPGAVRLTEARTLEFADGSLLSLPMDPAYQSWLGLATQLANFIALRNDASSVTADHIAPAWRRPTPFTVQRPGGDTLSLELLAARKTLTLLPMFRFVGLELVDGSGAPTYASLLGVPTPLVLGTLTRAQGTILRTRLGPLLDVAGLVAFPGP